ELRAGPVHLRHPGRMCRDHPPVPRRGRRRRLPDDLPLPDRPAARGRAGGDGAVRRRGTARARHRTGRMTLRIGVIGAAYAAATHLPAYRELAAEGIAEVVAVATARRQTAEETARRFAIPAVHVGYEALCTDPDVDLVDVVTRPSRHRVMASAAFASGKH